MSTQNVLLPSFLPGPSIFLESLDKDHPFEHAWKARAHTSPAIISWLYAWRGGAILWEAADRLFEVFLLPWMQSSELRLICEATRHLAYAWMKYVDSLDSSTEAMLGSIYTIEYLIVNRVWCRSGYGCTVWWLSFSAVDYIYTHSLCREGIHWSINGTGIMGMGWNVFCFFKHFCLFVCFARSHWFSRKVRRKTKNQQGSPLTSTVAGIAFIIYTAQLRTFEGAEPVFSSQV